MKTQNLTADCSDDSDLRGSGNCQIPRKQRSGFRLRAQTPAKRLKLPKSPNIAKKIQIENLNLTADDTDYTDFRGLEIAKIFGMA